MHLHFIVFNKLCPEPILLLFLCYDKVHTSSLSLRNGLYTFRAPFAWYILLQFKNTESSLILKAKQGISYRKVSGVSSSFVEMLKREPWECVYSFLFLPPYGPSWYVNSANQLSISLFLGFFPFPVKLQTCAIQQKYNVNHTCRFFRIFWIHK